MWPIIAILGEEIDPVAVQTFVRVKHHAPVVIQLFTGSLDVRNIDYAQMFFVHKANPLTQISLVELDGIFGEEHRRGGRTCAPGISSGPAGRSSGRAQASRSSPTDGASTTASATSSSSTCLKAAIAGTARLHQYVHINNADGTIYDHGKQILDNLAKDPDGIAVSNIRYANPEVKPLALSLKPGGPYITASKQSLVDGSYPLRRLIPAVIDREPGRPIDPKLREFLRYLLSREGQQVLIDDGRYLPLSAAEAATERRKLD